MTPMEKAQAKIAAAKAAAAAAASAEKSTQADSEIPVPPALQQPTQPPKGEEIVQAKISPDNSLKTPQRQTTPVERFWCAIPNNTVYPPGSDGVKFIGHTVTVRTSNEIYFLRQLAAQFPYKFKSLG